MGVAMAATQQLFVCALITAGLVTLRAASAEPQSDSEKIERLQRETTLLKEQLQRQTELMQKQLKALQEELRQAKLSQANKAGWAQPEQSLYTWKTSTGESYEQDSYTATPPAKTRAWEPARADTDAA